jgi:hypothetical protein
VDDGGADAQIKAAQRYIVSKYGGNGGSSGGGTGGGGGGGGGQFASGGSGGSSGGGAGGGGSSGGGAGRNGGASWTPVYSSGGGILAYIPGPGDFGELEPEPLVAPGSVTGYRWWTLPAPPDFRASPAYAERDWPHAPLHGQRAPWLPGVNQAVCLNGSHTPHDPGLLPAKECGCGYWAYWHPQDRRLSGAGKLQVFGVIKGFGKTRIGSYGFRCAKARLLAVHLAFTLVPFVGDDYFPGNRRKLIPRTMDDGRVLLIPGDITQEQAQHAVDHAEAWIAVIGDRLEQDNPGVVVCETRDALLTRFPPDEVYGNRFPPGAGHGLW